MRRHVARMAGVLATLSMAWVWAPCAAYAGTAVDAVQVNCVLQSASLNFGRLNLQWRTPYAGEGEAVVACQNTASEARRVVLSMTLASMGPQSAFLQSSHGALAVTFFRDAPHEMRWGDDRNGAASQQFPLELGPGERRLLRLPVYALLHNPRDAPAGVYLTRVAVMLTTLSN